MREELKDNALLQVKGTLLLEALAKNEGLSVEDSEIYEKIQEMAERANQDSDKVEKFYLQNTYARESLIKQLKEEKAIQFLIERAVITEDSQENQ
jgi:trigger factor